MIGEKEGAKDAKNGRVDRLCGRFERLEKWIALGGMLGVFLIVLMTVADVVLRYFFSSPLPGVPEISTILFVAGIFLCLGYTQSRDGHVRVVVFVLWLPEKLKKATEIFVLFLALSIMGCLTWTAGAEAIRSIKIGEMQWGAVLVPLWPAKVLFPLGTFLLCLQFMVDILKAAEIIGLKGDGERPW